MQAAEAKQAVLALIDERAAEVVELAAELIRRPSVNPDLEPGAAAEEAAQAYLRAWLEDAGCVDEFDWWTVEEGRPNFVGVRRGTGGGRSLTYSGHMDVVPVTPDQAEQWSGAGPWSAEIRDGKLWGRGASDMKGAIACYAAATRFLHDAGIRLKGDLLLAQSSGEESGRHEIGCDTVLDRGWTSDLAIFPEPTNFAIYPTLKGEIYFKLTVFGKSTHICNRHLVVQPLPHGMERPGVSAIDKMLKYQLAILDLEREWAQYRSHPAVEPGGQFININTIRGGDSFTSVPDSCEATGSLLFNPDLTSDVVMGELRDTIDRVTAGDSWLRAHPPVLELPFMGLLKEPVNMPWDHPGVEAISTATAETLGFTPARETAPWVCDANFWFPRGQPSVAFGPGDATWGIHGTNEFIPVEELIKGCKVFAAVAIDWCGVAGS